MKNVQTNFDFCLPFVFRVMWPYGTDGQSDGRKNQQDP